jgi:SAM-dependent methyltransferase
MEFPFYQSHEGLAASMSDTKKKWERLMMPASLDRKRVLDIGCNEGLVSSWCAKQGAASVIGIDFDKPRIEFARQRYQSERVQFLHQGWQELPAGPFDLILWTSAMHYERNPKRIFDLIYDRLSADGMLILECGCVARPGREMVALSRQTDTTYYPTTEFLRDVLLSKFSVREVGPGEVVPGDPVPRSVFHCYRRKPTVIFVTGKSGAGKTDIVDRYLAVTATKTVKIDIIVSRIATGQYVHGALQEAIKENYFPDNLGPIYKLLQEAPLLEEFINWLGEICVVSDDFIVIEGDLNTGTLAAFIKKYPDRRVWHASRFQ